MARKEIIGVIGTIGGGKSVAAAEMARLGGHLISADALGHEGLRDPDVKAQVKARFGDAIFTDDGDIDRRRLAAIVFRDASELRALEAIQFPFIGKRVGEEIVRAEANPAAKFIVLDAAVLLEAGWRSRCDRVVFIDAPRDIRLQRLRQNRQWTVEELDRRERSQMPIEQKRQAADATIENTGSAADLAVRVRQLLRSWNHLSEIA